MMKRIQFVKWSDRWHFQFIKGNPIKHPAAFHLIYKWSLWLGFIEIRKFMTEKQMAEALEIYHKNIDKL